MSSACARSVDLKSTIEVSSVSRRLKQRYIPAGLPSVRAERDAEDTAALGQGGGPSAGGGVQHEVICAAAAMVGATGRHPVLPVR